MPQLVVVQSVHYPERGLVWFSLQCCTGVLPFQRAMPSQVRGGARRTLLLWAKIGANVCDSQLWRWCCRGLVRTLGIFELRYPLRRLGRLDARQPCAPGSRC